MLRNGGYKVVAQCRVSILPLLITRVREAFLRAESYFHCDGKYEGRIEQDLVNDIGSYL